MKSKRRKKLFDPEAFLRKMGEGKAISKYGRTQTIFSQGEVADAVFYIQQGKVADDYLDRPLDLNELIIENAAATFAVRVASEGMTGAGIFPGDIAIVNRARTPVDGCIVLALLNREFSIKRYRNRSGCVWLQAENLGTHNSALMHPPRMPNP
jgi:SOS-response transcriptional repressor LexA